MKVTILLRVVLESIKPCLWIRHMESVKYYTKCEQDPNSICEVDLRTGRVEISVSLQHPCEVLQSCNRGSFKWEPDHEHLWVGNLKCAGSSLGHPQVRMTWVCDSSEQVKSVYPSHEALPPIDLNPRGNNYR